LCEAPRALHTPSAVRNGRERNKRYSVNLICSVEALQDVEIFIERIPNNGSRCGARHRADRDPKRTDRVRTKTSGRFVSSNAGAIAETTCCIACLQTGRAYYVWRFDRCAHFDCRQHYELSDRPGQRQLWIFSLRLDGKHQF
jgi:hypothetical protein